MSRPRLPVLVAILGIAVCRAAVAEPQSSSDAKINNVLYYRWTATGPGAGFTHSSLNAVEVDFSNSRFRHIMQSARAKQSMLPSQYKEIVARLGDTEWVHLSKQQLRRLATIIQVWLETDPPCAYNQWRGLGREDGYKEKLLLQASERKRSVEINPRASLSPDDSFRSPPEWHALTAYLNAMGSPVNQAITPAR